MEPHSTKRGTHKEPFIHQCSQVYVRLCVFNSTHRRMQGHKSSPAPTYTGQALGLAQQAKAIVGGKRWDELNEPKPSWA
eukprot:1161213-Pelagomonas_calceolata.AAC.11